MPFALAPSSFVRLVCGLLLLTAGALSTPTSSYAQAAGDVSLSITGLVQAETSYGWITHTDADNERDRLGFGLRRARLQTTARVGPKAGAFFHLDGDAGTFAVLDAFAFYNLNDRVRLRLGRMASAQPRAFILTPLPVMDTTERAAIALLWHGGTLGSKGRDFGIDLRYLTAQAEVLLFVHNGDGSFDRLRGNYQQNIVGDVTGGAERSLSDMAVSAYVAFRPGGVTGLELGGFAGYNGSRNPNTAVNDEGRGYVSYSAHAYWGAEPGSQPVRFKADVIGISYEELTGVPGQQVLGLSLLGAVGIHRAAEVFGRVESFNLNLDVEGQQQFFIAAGASVSPSRLRGGPYGRERLTLAYNFRLPEEDDAPLHHLLILQAQLTF